MPTFTRRRKPPEGKPPTWYKGCLRLDFQFRCAYCLIHESDYQSPEDFEVDHFEPQSVNRARAKEYANLYYACRLCNKPGRKGSNWPSREERERGLRFVDPCADDWEDHVEFQDDGSALPLSKPGEYSIRRIGLDRSQLRRHRVKFPGEYANRSHLRRVERALDRISQALRSRRNIAKELRQELRALKSQVPKLRRRVRAAWESKTPKPPPPHCPY